MLVYEENPDATPIELVSKPALEEWRQNQFASALEWVDRAKFKANPNQWLTLPTPEGSPGRIVSGIGDEPTLHSIGKLSYSLPVGDYRLAYGETNGIASMVLGWGLGAYRFHEYKKPEREASRLFVGTGMGEVKDQLEAVSLARDLISRPASDMLPEHLEREARKVAKAHNANVRITTGDDLLIAGFRTIHTVGRASASPPRLIDLNWGELDHPSIVILGKGVCFDSGGLDLKSAAGMRAMKKDMAGAAIALGLSSLIMSQKLPVRLRLLIPAVENAVAGNAYRPGDVITTYKKLTVEVGNTDAEGRLILCDALALAAGERPDLMIDFATLTGAARIAVGNQISALFCNDDQVAAGLVAAGKQEFDPIWRMPLYDGYREQLKSPVADLCNIASENVGGAITAALFLEAFVEKVPWAHFDIMAWNTTERPANPLGAEAMGLRATYRYLKDRYC